jgi:uncharacterized protein YbaA (DUF1428 family)
MIHELRIYTVVPGKQGEYIKLSGDVGRKARGDRFGKLEGHWSTEFGLLNQVVHLWSYPDLNERDRLREALAKNDDWTTGYLPQIRAMLMEQENKILSLQLPFKPPASDGHVYELRMYRTPVGRAGEWLAHFKAIMPVREKYSKNVGVWQTEMGQLNEVVHMWAYHDLNDRAAVRAKVMQDPEWQAFLAKATPLLVEMKSMVLNPSPHSPMK